MISLRKIEPSDLPFVYQWENDADSWADSSTHNPLSQQDLRDYIASTTGDIYRDGQLRLMIEEKTESGMVTVGCADLFDLDIRNRHAAMGLYIDPVYRGRGLAREAVLALEQYAFATLRLRMIYAVIAQNNTACTALYRGLGYLPSSPLPAWTLESAAVIWQKLGTEC